MPEITWDQTGEKTYETGVDKGVLYPMVEGAYPKGYAWNGLSNVSENPSGAESSPVYADNGKYLNLVSAEDYGATIEAYTYPNEFKECDGSKEIAPGVYAGQQTRKPFGFCYRTLIGNDTEGTEHGYKIHVVYGCLAAPSEQSHDSVNDSPEAMTMSWEISTTPVAIPALSDGTKIKPTATLVFDSTKLDPKKMKAVEEALYGSSTKEAHLPLPEEFITILNTEG